MLCRTRPIPATFTRSCRDAAAMGEQRPIIPPAPSQTSSNPAAGDFLGHPRGLAVLFATETWERFSYFGNAALIVLYMTKYLFEPGRVESVLGFGAINAAPENLVGPVEPQALASQLFRFCY